jgi:hypothetical protein
VILSACRIEYSRIVILAMRIDEHSGGQPIGIVTNLLLIDVLDRTGARPSQVVRLTGEDVQADLSIGEPATASHRCHAKRTAKRKLAPSAVDEVRPVTRGYTE